MNVTTIIENIGHGYAEDNTLGVLSFTVVASADGVEPLRFDVCELGGEYPPPATPRTPIIEPVMEPVMEDIIEQVTGEDGETHDQVTGRHQVGEHQIGTRIVDYTGGYTTEELAAIVGSVAQRRGAHAEAAARLESQHLKPFTPTPLPAHVPTDAERKQQQADFINDRVKAIYARFMDLRMEYELREAEAQSYKAGGYDGEPGALVKGFADDAGMTYRAASDLTLAQAAGLRSAIPALGNLRMKKYAVTAAATMEEAQAIFDQTLAAIDAIEAGLA